LDENGETAGKTEGKQEPGEERIGLARTAAGGVVMGTLGRMIRSYMLYFPLALNVLLNLAIIVALIRAYLRSRNKRVCVAGDKCDPLAVRGSDAQGW
jgi:hypothetical protein